MRILKNADLHPYEVYWVQEDQADERGDSFNAQRPIETFPKQFADVGWNTDRGNCASVFNTIGGVKLTKETLERYRQQQVVWAAKLAQSNEEYIVGYDGETPVKAKVSDAGNLMLKMLESAPPVKYQGNTANRRASVLPMLVHAYALRNGSPDGFKIKALICEYDDDHDRFEHRVAENKPGGRVGYGLLGMLAIACKCIAHVPPRGKTYVRELLDIPQSNWGSVQKLYDWGVICVKHPKLNLLKRALMPRPVDAEGKVIRKPDYDPNGWYPFSSVDAHCARALAGEAKVESMPQAIVDIYGEKIRRSATDAEVEKYIEYIMTRGSAGKEAFTAKDLQNIVKTCDVEVVCKLLTGLLRADSGLVTEAIGEIRLLVDAAKQ